jgi:hypothetical protein
MRTTRFLIATAVFTATLYAHEPPASVSDDTRGHNDTPIIAGQKWRVHDMERPRPAKVTPGPYVSNAPPADAIVLFDRKDISQWVNRAGAVSCRSRNRKSLMGPSRSFHGPDGCKPSRVSETAFCTCSGWLLPATPARDRA